MITRQIMTPNTINTVNSMSTMTRHGEVDTDDLKMSEQKHTN